MSIFGIFYNGRSPTMAMSRDPRSKFEKILSFPNSAFNIRKSYKISSRKALYFRSYQPKTSRGGGKHPPPPPSAFRVKSLAVQRLKNNELEEQCIHHFNLIKYLVPMTISI